MISPARKASGLRPDRLLSVVLGAGGVRGVAHVGVLEVMAEHGFRISEMVGASVGAAVIGFHVGVGMDLPAMREAGLNLPSNHFLTWALLRRLPRKVRERLRHRAGRIPDYMEQLPGGSFQRLHHGVSRIGIVAWDRLRDERVVCHSEGPIVSLADAVRGAVAIPRVLPPWRCQGGGRMFHLSDGAPINRLPVEALFEAPFQPEQILAVDISRFAEDRRYNEAKVEHLRRRHPDVPIHILFPDTFASSAILYRRSLPPRLLNSGRAAALRLLGETGAADPELGPVSPHPAEASNA